MKAVISVQGLAELISAGKKPLIVDVREAHELVSLPFNGAETVHIPLGQLGIRMNEIPKGQPVYMLCRSGGRSEMAQDMLLKAGYPEVYNIVGGTLAWVEFKK